MLLNLLHKMELFGLKYARMEIKSFAKRYFTKKIWFHKIKMFWNFLMNPK